MNQNDFENKLQRQEFRELPPEWRAEILSAAAACSSDQSKDSLRSVPKRDWLTALLWPHPKAWVALAAVWVAIAIFNHNSSESEITVAKRAPAPSRELILVWREQRRELVRLIEPAVPADLDQPKSIRPGSRSEVQDQQVSV
jgi:hypothetical protein